MRLINSVRRICKTGVAAGSLITCLFLCSYSLKAQDRCGTVPYMQKLQGKSVLETDPQFENWLTQKIQARNKQRGSERQQAGPYQIPVVIHVIHNGEAIGVGTNIPDAQVLSQINVLNKDYKRLNADASNTPAEFASVAGSLDVEFVLAKRNPEGLASNGIVRVKGQRSLWTINDNYELKAQSYWPAEDYLNIWVCDIEDYLGYAQFPVSGLPGLEDASTNRVTDGVVIWYKSFGSADDGAFDLDDRYNKGRTTTHEVGHFFGLRHIWGDDSNACGGNGDYVADTPDQSGSSSGCPSHPRTTCSVHSMFQNYLDYTDDACMNLFTVGQTARMVTVIENSPRRESLLTSPGLLDPVPVPNDLGIKTIVTPQPTVCASIVTPAIEVRNYGTNIITSARIRFLVDGSVIETKDFVLSLAAGASTTLTFAPHNFTAGNSDVSLEILLTNGGTDGDAKNNVRSVTVEVPPTISIPFLQPFNSLPADWIVSNPDGLTTWAVKTAPRDVATNKAVYMNFYDYEDKSGEIDLISSPVFDLSTATEAVLFFDVAHARFQGSNDGLRVYALTDCNASIYEGELVYEKFGSALATSSTTNVSFTPSGSSQWRRETVNLNAFVGEQNVRLVFVGINDWGNNLYVDNISLQTDPVEDIAITGISPSIITCNSSPQFKVSVINAGTITVTSFDIIYTINGTSGSSTVNGITLASGNSIVLTLPEINLDEGTNNVSIEAANPNGAIDINPSNNTINETLEVNTARDRIPLREKFEGNFTDTWSIINPTGGMEWETTTSTGSFSPSLYFNAFNNIIEGDEAWLVSPVLDFSFANDASLQFYTSYALNGSKSDRLRVLYSKDCGNSFEDKALFNQAGDNLSDIASTGSWTPQSETDWEHHILLLDSLTGYQDLRFAFVVTNSNGNNIYLDNIDFVTASRENPNLDERLFAVYQKDGFDSFYITFNLDQRQSVNYQVTDIMGRQLVQGDLFDALNQTFRVELAQGTADGIYVVRLRINGQFYATKIYLSH